MNIDHASFSFSVHSSFISFSQVKFVAADCSFSLRLVRLSSTMTFRILWERAYADDMMVSFFLARVMAV